MDDTRETTNIRVDNKEEESQRFVGKETLDAYRLASAIKNMTEQILKN